MVFLRRAYCVPYGGRGPPLKKFYVLIANNVQ